MSRVLWWRALRSRVVPNLLLVALSTLAVVIAALGPLLVRAIDQAAIAETLAEVGVKGTAITASTGAEPQADLEPLRTAVSSVLLQVTGGPASGLWQQPQGWVESNDNVAWNPRNAVGPIERTSRVQMASTGCPDLVLTTGRCPTASGQVLVSTADSAATGVKAGSVLVYRLQNLRGVELAVTGTYDPDRVSHPLTRPGTEAGVTAAVTADPLLVTSGQFAQLPLSAQVSSRIVLSGSPTWADEPLLRDSVTIVRGAALDPEYSIAVATQLGDTLDRVDRQRDGATVLVAVSEAQALALAGFALAVVLQRVGRARSAEWGIGRLLGVPRGRWFRSVYAEPGVALVAGLPVGLAVAALVGWLAISTNLRAGTPLELFRWPVLLAALAATVVGLVALVGVSLPSLRRPLAELIQQRSEPTGLTPLGAVAQATALLLAAATLYTLLAGGVLDTGGSQLGLLAPALFALALAVVAVRVAVVVVRRVTVRPARRLGALVVGRQAARTPSALTPAMVVAIGVALAVFATQVVALSTRNQLLRADAVTGAAAVLHVEAPRGTDLTALVRAAEPTGRYAMAVQERAREIDTGSDRIVAVDSSRLAAVAAWSPEWSGVADLAARLRPSQVAPLVLSGTRVFVDITNPQVRPGDPLSASASAANPRLELLLDLGKRWQTVELGPIAGATRLSAAVGCQRGCRVVALGLRSDPLEPYDATFTLTGIGTDRQPLSASAAWFSQPGRWHERVGAYYDPGRPQSAVPTSEPTGVEVGVGDIEGGGFPAIAPADVTDPLPAVLGPTTQLQPFAGLDGAVYGRGLDSLPQLLTVVGRASVLPRALGDGVLVDLPSAAAMVNPQNDSASDEVWLAPGTPDSVVSALQAAGLTVDSREELADAQATQLREPSTRAATAAGTLAYLSLLLTLLALVSARVADARRRRGDWRSLADAGVRTRTVRRLVALEIGVPALLGVVLGVVAGLTGLVLAAPRLPLVDLSVPGPPLDLRISWSAALVIGVAAALAVAVVALVGGWLETRRRSAR